MERCITSDYSRNWNEISEVRCVRSVVVKVCNIADAIRNDLLKHLGGGLQINDYKVGCYESCVGVQWSVRLLAVEKQERSVRNRRQYRTIISE